MEWLLLLLAGIAETVWAVALKFSEGFTRFWTSLITIVAMAISFYFLALAMKNIPISIAYPVWTGIGSVGTVIIGIAVFGDAITTLKIICLILIIMGVVGLKVL